MHSRSGPEQDAAFLDKMAQVHTRHAHWFKRGKDFEVKHYAGQVAYDVEGFGQANMDALPKSVILDLQASSASLIPLLFPEEIDMNDKRAATTAGNKIRGQCDSLVKALMECNPHYVRCIKSNEKKKPMMIDDERVKHQIQYLGLMENIKVRRAGYAYRAEYHRFLDRFKLISKETYPREWKGTDKKGAQAICKAASARLPNLRKETQLGKTMIFISSPETYFELEKLREMRISSFACTIQQCWNRFSGRRHFVHLNLGVAQLYAAQNPPKRRSRHSIYRPFYGDYLNDEASAADAVMAAENADDRKGKKKKSKSKPAPTGPKKDGVNVGVRDAFLDILDELEREDEKIKFIDWVERVVGVGQKKGSKEQELQVETYLLVITDAAIYWLQRASEDPVMIAAKEAMELEARNGAPTGGSSATCTSAGTEGEAVAATPAAQLPLLVFRRWHLLSSLQCSLHSLTASSHCSSNQSRSKQNQTRACG
jgi:hypothetical protein